MKKYYLYRINNEREIEKWAKRVMEFVKNYKGPGIISTMAPINIYISSDKKLSDKEMKKKNLILIK